jgi:uncharacterized protein YukJ
MFEADPSLEGTSIVLKYGFVKDKLNQLWKDAGRPRVDKKKWKPIPYSSTWGNPDSFTAKKVLECCADPEVQHRVKYQYPIFVVSWQPMHLVL